VPGSGPDPHPVLLSHGWPGSVLEFLELIPRLTEPERFGADPADAFTVVAPGYGLSFAPGEIGEFSSSGESDITQASHDGRHDPERSPWTDSLPTFGQRLSSTVLQNPDFRPCVRRSSAR
jgi:pimeloyl-ACP methyl ester carboxylesterase